ncbi:hypothetical protein M8Z33_09735 [Streptomyces sp. ZAF1911]|uniref:hypothetical protein n=1 Tax=Streptomyces sp. ZAF1911 TaxID=2944129 RepID=UPI00237B1657|nr:hypothetical protein [Streptomyces sp. ZAF1911]MDD9376942.1 hypothetical protein [Streptomyces sp. ZAF1911]
MSNRTIPTPAHTNGRPLRPAPPPGPATTPYRSTSCAIGTHHECAQSPPATAPVGVPVIYEACACPCHTPDDRAHPRRVTQ